MFRFENPFWSILFIAVPIIIVVFISFINWRKKRIQRLGNPATIQHQIQGIKVGRHTTKFILIIICICFTIMGLINIQQNDATETVNRKGIDLIFALDVSKSMLAEDVKPNRLAKAKQLMNAIINKMHDNRIGLVVFAGKSYLQVPITIDYSAAKMLIDATDPSLIPSQGTALADAINLSNESFASSNKKFKTIILITDGEDHEQDALTAAKKAYEEGTIIYTVGIGSKEGVTLTDPTTQQAKLDEKGQPIITKLNEQILKDIAQEGHGKFFSLGNTNETAQALLKSIDKMEKDDLGSTQLKNYKHYFPYLALIAFILFIIDWALPYGVNSLKNKLS